MRTWLIELVRDEQSRLDFHCCFLRSQCDRAWKRGLELNKREIWKRWTTFGRLAERLVVRSTPNFIRVC